MNAASRAACRAACRAATAHLSRGDVAGAAAVLTPALAAAPDDPELLFVAGNLALARGDEDEALDRYERSVAGASDFPAALMNLGFVLRRRQRLDEARGVLRRCVELAPTDPHAWLNLTSTFVNEGEPEAGEAVAREALGHCPTSPAIRWNLGLMLLEQGRWREGWREYAHRFDTPVMRPPLYGPDAVRPPRLVALDELRPGWLVVCHGEQGLGDELLFAGMFGEFLAAARDRGVEVLLDANPRLRGLFGRNFPVGHLGDGTAAGRAAFARPIDRVVPLGDLGMFFRTEPGQFPDRGRYLAADQDRVAALRRELAGRARGRPLVGLAWSGGTSRTHAVYRHIPLVDWLPVLRRAACFVSLEYRDRAAEIAALRERHGIDMLDLPEVTRAADYERTCELVAALDRVITVPTSVLHVAGAVGTPCLVVMHHRAAWRECSADDRIPWYPRTHRRLVRGPAETDWQRVVAAVAADLPAD